MQERRGCRRGGILAGAGGAGSRLGDPLCSAAGGFCDFSSLQEDVERLASMNPAEMAQLSCQLGKVWTRGLGTSL